MNLHLQERVIIVTGAASGIGRAAAQLLAAEGARVVIFDIDRDGAEATRDGCTGAYPPEVSILDLSDASQVEQAVAQVSARYTRLDGIVNVAGGSGRRFGDGPLHSCTLEGWQKTLALNLDSLFFCCKYGLQAMLPHNKGVIVTVSSVLGLVGGDEDFATHAYAASKGAAVSLTRSIAAYYAPYGIRANAICPGLIATPMSQRAQNNPAIRERLSQLQPLSGDFGAPEDVAGAAAYLVSDVSAFVTGAILTVDGGWTVR